MNIRIGEKVKTKLTLSIESEIVEKAKNLGLNISQFCENALKIGITALENANRQIALNQTASAEREGMETVGCHQAQISGMGARLIIWRANGA